MSIIPQPDHEPLVIVIPHRPVPKARARYAGWRFYTPQTTQEYERTVAALATFCRNEWAHRTQARWPLDRTYAVDIRLFLMPKVRMDVDNVVKAALDACRRILWDDDRQVRQQNILRIDVDQVADEKLDMTIRIER